MSIVESNVPFFLVGCSAFLSVNKMIKSFTAKYLWGLMLVCFYWSDSLKTCFLIKRFLWILQARLKRSTSHVWPWFVLCGCDDLDSVSRLGVVDKDTSRSPWTCADTLVSVPSDAPRLDGSDVTLSYLHLVLTHLEINSARFRFTIREAPAPRWVHSVPPRDTN